MTQEQCMSCTARVNRNTGKFVAYFSLLLFLGSSSHSLDRNLTPAIRIYQNISLSLRGHQHKIVYKIEYSTEFTYVRMSAKEQSWLKHLLKICRNIRSHFHDCFLTIQHSQSHQLSILINTINDKRTYRYICYLQEQYF